MGRRTAGLLAVALAVVSAPGPSPALAAGDPRPAPAPARTPEFVAKVNGAIRDGVRWVSRGQREDGSFSGAPSTYDFVPPNDLGLQALAVYTVRACGLPAEDPVARLGYKRLRQYYLANRRAGLLQTYQVSLTLLAIEAYTAPEEAEGEAGERYGKSLHPRRRATEADLSWARELVTWLLAAQTESGSFGYGRATGWEDHSNAQFALLGLKAARRLGVEVPKKTFQRALDHFLKAQKSGGPEVTRRTVAAKETSAVRDHARGWGYQCDGRGRSFATGTMTTAGVSSLVICRSELLGSSGFDAADDARVVQAVHDGLAWLGRHFAVTSHRGGTWHYYYLYGLERAGVLSGVHWMADREWYGEGAAYLLDARQENGGWSSSRLAAGELMDTCFALLFLKKATFRVEGAVATVEADQELDLTGAADLDKDSFGAIFDTVFGRYARADGARRATLVVDFVRMGKRALPLLIQRLEDADPAVRTVASMVLERVTGMTHGFRPEDPVDARAAAVAAWETWWFARRGRLSPDVGAGRFRD
jgi:hypothetical protein